MPTVLTHALIPLIGAWAAGKDRVPPRLAFAGVVAAVLPDADAIGFVIGIPYDHELGHRVASHSITAALVLAPLAAALARPLRAKRLTSFLFVLVAALSHGVTDMLTNGGRGVALLWPISDARLFAPFRPIEVSPIGAGFFGDSAIHVLGSEFLWLLLLLTIFAALCRHWPASASLTERSRRHT